LTEGFKWARASVSHPSAPSAFGGERRRTTKRDPNLQAIEHERTAKWNIPPHVEDQLVALDPNWEKGKAVSGKWQR
jgi:hypothetical protein